jgi:ribonuclease P protein component
VKRQYRITRANDFRRVRQNCKIYPHPLIRVLVSEVPGEQKRIGIIVSKPVGTAVKRNLVKRRIRSVANELIQQLNKEVDILLIANPPIATADYQQIRMAIATCLKKAELLVE